MISVNRWASRSQKSDDLKPWRDFYFLPLYSRVYMFRYFFYPRSNRTRQQYLKPWIINTFDLLEETEKLILWNLDSGKDNCPSYSVLPDLALSSSFISYTHYIDPCLHSVRSASLHCLFVKPFNEHLLCHASPEALDEFPVKIHKVSGYTILLYIPP